FRNRDVRSRPRWKFGRLPAGDLIRQRNRLTRIPTEVRVRLEVGERRRDFGSTRKRRSERFLRDLLERILVPLSIERDDDFVEAHEITDERQILTMAGLIRVRERARDDVA